jgi:murein L,D-transpeptidase YcbB/YkuD
MALLLLSLNACAEDNSQPLWTKGGRLTQQGLSLAHVLCAADTYGLRTADYLDCGRFNGSVPGADVELTRAALRFLRDVHFGRVDPHQVGFELGGKRQPLAYDRILAALSAANDPEHMIAAFEPPFRHYRLLKDALARYRSLALDDTKATPAERRSAPYERRIRQIELTLERWRWLPELRSPPIIVNIPEFRLFAFESTNDFRSEIAQMDVIVGRTFPKLRTPVFAAEMRYLIFRPYWDVPYSITHQELLPELRAKPDLWQRQHLELVSGPGDNAPVVPFTADNLDRLEAGQLRLRQAPGPDNALGLVKFMLPNPYNVYLHSTPARQLFSRSKRAFSHGCIRVSDPVALATRVLHNASGIWTQEAVNAAMNGTNNLRVNLKTPIPVLIVYATALAQEDGTTLFFDDIYGHDRKLERLLGMPALVTHQRR